MVPDGGRGRDRGLALRRVGTGGVGGAVVRTAPTRLQEKVELGEKIGLEISLWPWAPTPISPSEQLWAEEEQYFLCFPLLCRDGFQELLHFAPRM